MPLRVEKIRKVVKSRVSGMWGQRKILPTHGGVAWVAPLEGHGQCLVRLSPDAPSHPSQGDFHWVCKDWVWAYSLHRHLWKRIWRPPGVCPWGMGRWDVVASPREPGDQREPRNARLLFCFHWLKTENNRIFLTSCHSCKFKIYALKIKHVLQECTPIRQN